MTDQERILRLMAAMQPMSYTDRATLISAADKLAELEIDATRYRWLKDKSKVCPLPMVRVLVMRQGQYLCRKDGDLDSEVDAGIAKAAAVGAA